MKKIYFVVLMLLVCTGGFSQKVKIKKNIISLDNVEVGITEKYKNDETKEIGYTYSDLKGENKFTMIRYNLGEDKLFFVVRPSFAKDTAEIKMKYLYFTLNEQNALTDLLIKNYHFFDKNGLNKDSINSYLSAEHEPQIPALLQDIQEQKQVEQAVRAMDIRVADNGKIIKGSNQEIGLFIAAPNPKENISPNNRIVIKDEAGNDIAAVTSGGWGVDNFKATILTYDKKTFEIEESYDVNKPTRFYQKIVEFLAQKEYLQGQRNSYIIQKAEFDREKAEYDQIRMEKAQERAADIEARREVEGILTLKDGTKIEGTFRFDYRQTPEGRITSEGSIADLDAGKILFHFYQDAKGKNKTKKYGVKDVSTFYLNDGEVYESVTYKKGNLLTNAISDGSLNVGKLLGGNKTQKFLLRLAVTEKARLYFYEGEYILMKPDSEEAIVGKVLSKADLQKFTSDCPTISQKIADNEYNDEENSYIQLIEDYTRCN